jgi:hypothetical protein
MNRTTFNSLMLSSLQRQVQLVRVGVPEGLGSNESQTSNLTPTVLNTTAEAAAL